MRKPILVLTAILFFSSYLFAQNSMVGDGFGGRGWYVPHNFQAGAYSAFAICGDSNQLYGWGSNNINEFGNGSNVSTITPIAIPGMTDIKFYTTGYYMAAIKFDSSVWVWGNGQNFPLQVALNSVKFADAGARHIVFVRQDGTVWGVGLNEAGELGNGTKMPASIGSPVQMTGVTNAVRAVAIGNYADSQTVATLILLSNGYVKITGGGGWFQTTYSTIPIPLIGLNNIVDIKGGAYGAYALNSHGEVYSFGRDRPLSDNGLFVLGLGITSGDITQPTKVIFPANAASIVAISANNDGYSCLALDSNHNVYAWGYNLHGQLGDGTFITKPNPILVATNAIDIFAGENHSYILKSDGSLWATGQSGYGGGTFWGSIWMNPPNIQRNVFTQIDPTIAPMNLCAPKVWGVVPIKLSSFTCVANGNAAYLNWQSAEETNASKYIVQYSNDGSSFKDITTVFATGSNSKYNYIHQQVSGTAFYRLKMIDKDGSFTYSEIRVVKFDNKAGFTIAPNPADDMLYLFTKNNAVIKSIQILSFDGQVAKILNGYNSGQQISISTIAKGTYILKAIYQNNETAYAKFMKI